MQEGQRGRLYGAILLEEGLVTEDQLRDALKKKAEESVYDLFLWPDGAFEFKDEDEPDDFAIQIGLRVPEVVMEGVRRMDEWQRMQAVEGEADSSRFVDGDVFLIEYNQWRHKEVARVAGLCIVGGGIVATPLADGGVECVRE